MRAPHARGKLAESMAALGAQAERLGAGDDRQGALARGPRVALLVAVYAAVGIASAGVSLALGRDPLGCEGWLDTRGTAAVLVSLGLGVGLGGTTIAASRILVRRVAWAQALHAALRPAVHGAGNLGLIAVAVASAAGEEVLFRGLVLPLVGVALSSVLFGALHQIRGSARWGWMLWATVMGALFGCVFAATGSLAGPIVAHAMINGANLRFLRDNDPSPRPRALGGLLRR
ncbi:MAG TPA: CPBP family intramembrane glutamic endopeptidase [Polyangiaceae bacterium]